MSTISDSVRVSEDSFDSRHPTRSEWADFRHFLDADFDGYPDEAPELDDIFFFDPAPEDLAWLAALTEGGYHPDHGTPFDLELLTVTAHDQRSGEEPDDDHPHDSFLGGMV
jgi:hypothetical protein